MPRFLAVLLVVAVLAFWGTPAMAMVVRDGERFSIDTGVTPVCLVYPASQRDEAACEGFTDVDKPIPALDKGQRAIASGVVLLRTVDGVEDRAFVTVIEAEQENEKEPTTADAIGFAIGLRMQVSSPLPPGAKVRDCSGDVVKVGKHPLIRARVGVEGIPEDHPDATDAHQVFLAAYADKHLYVVHVGARASSRAEADAFADQIARTLTLAKPARRSSSSFEAGRIVGQLLVYGAIGAVILFVVIARSRRRAALARQQYPGQHGHGQPPYGYRPQPPQGDPYPPYRPPPRSESQ